MKCASERINEKVGKQRFHETKSPLRQIALTSLGLALIEVALFLLPFDFHHRYRRVTRDLLQFMRRSEADSRSTAKMPHSHKVTATVPHFARIDYCLKYGMD